MSTTAPTYLKDGLWEESGEWVWLVHADYENAAKAKYAAFSGAGLPVGFRESGCTELTDLRCRIVYARPGEQDEEGWAGRGEDMWWRCESDHPKAVKFYEVRCVS